MKCTSPFHGWRSKKPNENGKYPIVYDRKIGQLDQEITHPCGGCTGCRITAATQMGIRSMHEAKFHPEPSTFITMTYDEEHLPENHSINKEDPILFHRRLEHHIRLENSDYPNIRRQYVGEYGGQTSRPHYHGILYGYTFPDMEGKRTNDNGDIIYDSKICEKIWGKGIIELGTVTPQSASYVARHNVSRFKNKDPELVKAHYQYTDLNTGEIHDRIPEFHMPSLRPGIGKIWYDHFKEDLRKGYITDGKGGRLPIPAYYEKLMQREETTELYEAYKANKLNWIDPDSFENHGLRLRVIHDIQEKRSKKLKRNLL